MQSLSPKPNRQFSKHVSVRFTVAEHQLLHRIAPKGGIQALIRSWIDERLAAMRRLDAECCGEKGEGK
jgi:hypothetical protein